MGLRMQRRREIVVCLRGEQASVGLRMFIRTWTRSTRRMRSSSRKRGVEVGCSRRRELLGLTAAEAECNRKKGLLVLREAEVGCSRKKGAWPLRSRMVVCL